MAAWGKPKNSNELCRRPIYKKIGGKTIKSFCSRKKGHRGGCR